MLRDNYDKALFQQQRKRKGTQNRSLTKEELQICELEAKAAVCEIGISMYEFRKRMRTIYDRTVETDAIHEAVELGITNKLLLWGQARRYDEEKGLVGQNIVLSDEGFKAISEEGTQRTMTITHSSYLPKLRG